MKIHKHYYDKKYPLLYYAEGGMYSINPIVLIKLYQAYFHKKPKQKGKKGPTGPFKYRLNAR